MINKLLTKTCIRNQHFASAWVGLSANVGPGSDDKVPGLVSRDGQSIDY